MTWDWQSALLVATAGMFAGLGNAIGTYLGNRHFVQAIEAALAKRKRRTDRGPD